MRQREHAIQIAIAHMLQVVLDPEETWWTAIDHGAGKLSRRSAGMMKARGVQRGLPDFIILTRLPHPRPLIGIEVKTATGGLSESQRELHAEWGELGYVVFVARDLEDVQLGLERHAIPMRRQLKFLDGGRYVRPVRSAPTRHRSARRARRAKDALSVVQPDEAQET